MWQGSQANITALGWMEGEWTWISGLPLIRFLYSFYYTTLGIVLTELFGSVDNLFPEWLILLTPIPAVPFNYNQNTCLLWLLRFITWLCSWPQLYEHLSIFQIIVLVFCQRNFTDLVLCLVVNRVSMSQFSGVWEDQSKKKSKYWTTWSFTVSSAPKWPKIQLVWV